MIPLFFMRLSSYTPYDTMTDPQAASYEFLQSTLAHEVERIDTHGATIFLAGDRAWKMKRAIRFPYMDFSTVERRHHALHQELTLNRRTARDLYLALHAITRDASGTLSLDGEGETIDWVLEMQRFPAGCLLSQLAEQDRLSREHIRLLIDSVVDFHDHAPIFLTPDGYTRFLTVTQGNMASLEACVDILGDKAVNQISQSLLAELAKAKSLLIERSQAGRVRHVHGDLHLANITLIEGVPTPFDCLEFDDELAITDTLYDLAFLLMDLWQRDLQTLANHAFNRYLDRTQEDEHGIALLPLFLATRAVIRAHVGAAQAQRVGRDSAVATQARRYLQLAQQFLHPSTPSLIAIGGLSGSGKSTVAHELAPTVGRAPGARLIRSDVLRKRLAGVTPETRLPASAYTLAQNEAVYGAMGELAVAGVQSGQSVIVDAVFARHHERVRIGELAEAAQVPFHGFWLDCSLKTRVARVEGRSGDASDADAAVARIQEADPLTEPGWRSLNTDLPTVDLATQMRIVNP